MDIDTDCHAKNNIAACPGVYEATADSVGVYTNSTKRLKDGEMCLVTVVARDNVARVIFDNSDNLGVLLPDYIMGQPYSVK